MRLYHRSMRHSWRISTQEPTIKPSRYWASFDLAYELLYLYVITCKLNCGPTITSVSNTQLKRSSWMLIFNWYAPKSDWYQFLLHKMQLKVLTLKKIRFLHTLHWVLQNCKIINRQLRAHLADKRKIRYLHTLEETIFIFMILERNLHFHSTTFAMSFRLRSWTFISNLILWKSWFHMLRCVVFAYFNCHIFYNRGKYSLTIKMLPNVCE